MCWSLQISQFLLNHEIFTTATTAATIITIAKSAITTIIIVVVVATTIAAIVLIIVLMVLMILMILLILAFIIIVLVVVIVFALVLILLLILEISSPIISTEILIFYTEIQIKKSEFYFLIQSKRKKIVKNGMEFKKVSFTHQFAYILSKFVS